MPSPLTENLQSVLDRVAAARERSSHPSGGTVDLLAVTKAVGPDAARALVEAGQLDLGENRIDELEAKAQALSDPRVRWHFIGHVQHRKVRRVAALADVVHSLDSARLARTLDRAAAELGRRIDVYVQVNATDEPQKYGLPPAEVPALFELLGDCPALRPRGLMVMGPTDGDPAGTRAAFEATARLARELEGQEATRRVLADGRCRLSMGMSGDLELAVECGSDLVRIGTALFAGVAPAAGKTPPAAPSERTRGAE